MIQIQIHLAQRLIIINYYSLDNIRVDEVVDFREEIENEK